MVSTEQFWDRRAGQDSGSYKILKSLKMLISVPCLRRVNSSSSWTKRQCLVLANSGRPQSYTGNGTYAPWGHMEAGDYDIDDGDGDGAISDENSNHDSGNSSLDTCVSGRLII